MDFRSIFNPRERGDRRGEGLDTTREMTLAEIGRQFNITRERVRQIKEKALRKLRHAAPARRLIPYVE